MIGFDLAEARDFLALLGAMVFGTLKFMVTAGVMAASLHLFLLILHRKRKGFTVSFQLVCYSQGVSSLMSMVVTILTAGISMAGPAAATICLWAGGTAELLIKLFSLFLIFAGLLAGHKLGRIKAGLVIILFVAFWVGVGLWLVGR